MKPLGQACQISRRRLGTVRMLPAEVVVQILMDIDCGVVDRILDLVQLVCRRHMTLRALAPGMAARVTVSRRKDELFGAGVADAVDGGLVILQDESGGHVVRLGQSGADW